VVGILAAQIVNWRIADPVPDGATAEMIRLSWNGQVGWRWMFTAVAIPATVFFFAALAAPESPRWLALRGRRDEARRILARVGGESLEEVEAGIHGTERVRFAELWAPGVRRILLIGIGLAVLQQWCGINVIFNYAEEIYRGAGYGVSDILFNIVITGAINFACTIAAMGMVDRLGRRPLMLAGCVGIGLSHLLLGAAYRMGWKGPVALGFTLSTIGCFAMTLGPVVWVLISEIFPNRIRGAAVSVAVSALWIACFVLTYTFPWLNRTLGAAGTFWLYAAVCFAGFGFVRTSVRETKGQSLEQLEMELTE
jgi:sugar porter (SP) family MFS transporter